jgi:16S rRNA (guanine966-N2)-methyltransferase
VRARVVAVGGRDGRPYSRDVRVIAGAAKGVRLAPVPRGVRPVSDMAREGLFSSIAADVPGSIVLDLYAGTGALGIEALSRGADEAVFVERSEAAAAVVRSNLAKTRLQDRATLLRRDVVSFVTSDDTSAGPFDLVLLDPPYDVGPPELDRVLAAVGDRWLTASGWTVALTRGSRSSMPVIPVNWLVSRRLEYGDSLVLVCRQQ